MSEPQIIRDIACYPGETTPMHRWSMVIDGQTVSELWVATDTHEIMQVETPSQHQGSGYASALYRQAASEIAIYHAPASHRTPAGNRFAAAVGGDALDCRYGCCDQDDDEE